MPGTPWKENSAIILKRVATVHFTWFEGKIRCIFYFSFSKIISLSYENLWVDTQACPSLRKSMY